MDGTEHKLLKFEINKSKINLLEFIIFSISAIDSAAPLHDSITKYNEDKVKI